MRTYSLRLRILFGILAAVALVWSVVGVIAYREARHEAEELLDAHLAQSATLLFAFLGDEADDIGERLPRHRYDKKVAFQVWEGERLLTRSHRAPDSRLSPREEGFSDVHIDGKPWRVFSVRDARRHYLIQVADAAESRAEISNEVASHLLQTMGVGLPYALGAAIANPDRQVACITGDGSIQMCIQELATAKQYNLPVKIIALNNRFLGMVRQWQQMFYNGRYSQTYMDSLPDFVKLAEAYGHVGIRVDTPEEVEPALRKAFIEHKDDLVFLDIRTERETNVYPMVAAGKGLSEIIMAEPL